MVNQFVACAHVHVLLAAIGSIALVYPQFTIQNSEHLDLDC